MSRKSFKISNPIKTTRHGPNGSISRLRREKKLNQEIARLVTKPEPPQIQLP